MTSVKRKVLAIGIYLSDEDNHAVKISDELKSASAWQVDFFWGAIGNPPPANRLESVTRVTSKQKVDKFELLNRLLADLNLDDYEYLLVTDDDIELPNGFVDAYLELVERRGFHLAQPARTHESYSSHYFVAQLVGVESRRTRFVEIGPLFSLHRNAFRLLLPFDEEAPMGWGLDFLWPKQLEEAGLSLGIVDQIPLGHTLRKPTAFYDYDRTSVLMQKFLKEREHLTPEKCYVAQETWQATMTKREG